MMAAGRDPRGRAAVGVDPDMRAVDPDLRDVGLDVDVDFDLRRAAASARILAITPGVARL
jgi:hypothetical protein